MLDNMESLRPRVGLVHGKVRDVNSLRRASSVQASPARPDEKTLECSQSSYSLYACFRACRCFSSTCDSVNFELAGAVEQMVERLQESGYFLPCYRGMDQKNHLTWGIELSRAGVELRDSPVTSL